MRRILSLFMTLIIISILCSCGISAEKIAATTIKQQELIKLYDSVAPTVAKLDEASVQMYDEIGKTVRKSINAISNDFDGYDNDDIDKLSIDMDSAILSLRAVMSDFNFSIKRLSRAETDDVSCDNCKKSEKFSAPIRICTELSELLI